MKFNNGANCTRRPLLILPSHHPFQFTLQFARERASGKKNLQTPFEFHSWFFDIYADCLYVCLYTRWARPFSVHRASLYIRWRFFFVNEKDLWIWALSENEALRSDLSRDARARSKRSVGGISNALKNEARDRFWRVGIQRNRSFSSRIYSIEKWIK